MKEHEKDAQSRGRSFLWFIGIAYATQGIAQHFCLVAQPLDYYMLKALGKNSADVAALLSILMIPWMVKPLYGILSDFFPLAGYRRKSYMSLAYGAAGLSYLCAACLQSLPLLFSALLLTATGMAVGTTIVSGLTLEVGRPTQKTRSFQSIQAVCYYTANVASFLVGGMLCASFDPNDAISYAACIAAVPCMATAFLSWHMLKEPKSERTKFSGKLLLEMAGEFKKKGLLLVALFLCCWSFSPGFGTPLYFHETKVLGYSQLFIGQLGAVNAVGMIVGALTFKMGMDRRLTPRMQALTSVVLGTCSTIGYLWLSSPESAIALEFCRGVANIIAILTMYGLAADVTPKKIESSTIALLISAYNIAEQVSNVLGANLYTYTFDGAFAPLIVVSALATLACIVLVPLLPQRDQHAD